MQATKLPPPSGPSLDERPDPRVPPPPPRTTDPRTWNLPKLAPASWLAATGSAMLLLASVVVVASRWDSIAVEIRFSALVASLLAIYFVAESGRERFPATSTALATLAATLTAPVGIAAASSIGQTWPVCVLVGGLGALVATEVQSHRWQVPILKVATVAAVCLAAAGLAALTGVPVGLIGAGAAVAAMALGATRRSIALGLGVGFSPFLVALGDAGVGPGTLADMGATGDVLDWSAPLAGSIAALVIGIAAHRRNEIVLAAAAAATLASGVLVGMAQADVAPVAWWCVPALLLIATEVVALLGRRSVWGIAADGFRIVIWFPVLLGGLAAPALAWIGRGIQELSGDGPDSIWALPPGLTAAALLVATAGAIRRAEHPWIVEITFAAAAAAAFAAVVATGSTAFGWPEVAALAGIATTTAIVGRSQSPGWIHAAAVLFVAVAGSALAVGNVEVDQSALLLMALAIALTGIAFLRPIVTPLDTAAIATGGLLVLVSLSGSPAVMSLALTTVSAQLVMYALARREFIVAAFAAIGFSMSLISLWWTTGTNDFVITQIRPYGADGADLVLGFATIALLLTGILLRRFQSVSTWLAYSPGLGMAAAWLLEAQLDPDATWATMGAIGVGITATAVGGLRRLVAPQVIGTGMIGATVLISAGPRLAEAPTWIWIAVGGIGLLVLAAVIERNDSE